MAPKLTYEVYCDDYCGKMEEDDFDAALPSATARLVAIAGADIPERHEHAWLMALCALCDRAGGLPGPSGAPAGVKSETVGGTNVTYADAAAAGSDYDAALPWLSGTGLLYSGAGCRR
ncbi:hypothetical protein [Enorma sp.]|nr:hypothetical protein [Enorma sp.]